MKRRMFVLMFERLSGYGMERSRWGSGLGWRVCGARDLIVVQFRLEAKASEDHSRARRLDLIPGLSFAFCS